MEAVCRNCGYTRQVQEIPGINAVNDPELKARLKDGSLFVWECPCCGQRNLCTFQTLYHDPERMLMVWLLPKGETPPAAVDDAVKQLSGYTLRKVREAGDLIEKVNIADSGLDDVVMEMCKYVTSLELYKKTPDKEILSAPLRFMRMDGPDNDIVLAFPHGGNMQVVNIGFNVYEDARAILSRNPAAAPGDGFTEIDRNYILQFFR